MPSVKLISLIFVFIAFSGLVRADQDSWITESEKLHSFICSTPTQSTSPWRASNIYDCSSRLLFIPYQMWTGAKWNGSKSEPCMHKADSTFEVNDRSETTIKGPIAWKSPKSGEQHSTWIREKSGSTKIQYFICHAKGIGRVFDNRGDRYFKQGRCKFPAGLGWQIAKRRHCLDTSIEITALGFDENRNLNTIEFKWWSKSTLDHKYRYKAEYGMTTAEPQ